MAALQACAVQDGWGLPCPLLLTRYFTWCQIPWCMLMVSLVGAGCHHTSWAPPLAAGVLLFTSLWAFTQVSPEPPHRGAAEIQDKVIPSQRAQLWGKHKHLSLEGNGEE